MSENRARRKGTSSQFWDAADLVNIDTSLHSPCAGCCHSVPFIASRV